MHENSMISQNIILLFDEIYLQICMEHPGEEIIGMDS